MYFVFMPVVCVHIVYVMIYVVVFVHLCVYVHVCVLGGMQVPRTPLRLLWVLLPV